MRRNHHQQEWPGRNQHNQCQQCVDDEGGAFAQALVVAEPKDTDREQPADIDHQVQRLEADPDVVLSPVPKRSGYAQTVRRQQ